MLLVLQILRNVVFGLKVKVVIIEAPGCLFFIEWLAILLVSEQSIQLHETVTHVSTSLLHCFNPLSFL